MHNASASTTNGKKAVFEFVLYPNLSHETIATEHGYLAGALNEAGFNPASFEETEQALMNASGGYYDDVSECYGFLTDSTASSEVFCPSGVYVPIEIIFDAMARADEVAIYRRPVNPAKGHGTKQTAVGNPHGTPRVKDKAGERVNRGTSTEGTDTRQDGARPFINPDKYVTSLPSLFSKAVISQGGGKK